MNKPYSHIAAVDDVCSAHECLHTQSRSSESGPNIFIVLGVSDSYREWATYQHISRRQTPGHFLNAGWTLSAIYTERNGIDSVLTCKVVLTVLASLP